MRLINTETMEIEVFDDERLSITKYAILSHVWRKGEEVTFQEMQVMHEMKDLYPALESGYLKLLQASKLAKGQNLKYLWADTCCINKLDHVELSEAINSMFRWYENAQVCYVYLYDVPYSPGGEPTSFEHSVWFTRGWTLQELLAPERVEFYDQNWASLGTKGLLSKKITERTRIPHMPLLYTKYVKQVSVATRMSWAADRQTSRREDIAYCLMGLFGIHMTMNYGEGENAFYRLQKKIIKSCRDHSIFAWEPSYDGPRDCPVLASSPAAFKNSDAIDQSMPILAEHTSFILNQGELEIALPLIPWGMHTFVGVLNCVRTGSVNYVGILLERIASSWVLVRKTHYGALRDIDARLLSRVQEDPWISKLWWQKKLISETYVGLLHPREICGIKLDECPGLLNFGIGAGSFSKVYTQDREPWDSSDPWDGIDRLIRMPVGLLGTVAILCLWEASTASNLIIKLGFDTNHVPGIFLSKTIPLDLRPILLKPIRGLTSKEWDRILDSSWILDDSHWENKQHYDRRDLQVCTSLPGWTGGIGVRDPQRKPLRYPYLGWSLSIGLNFDLLDKGGLWVFRAEPAQLSKPSTSEATGSKNFFKRSLQVRQG